MRHVGTAEAQLIFYFNLVLQAFSKIVLKNKTFKVGGFGGV